jgi:hypothetical protein
LSAMLTLVKGRPDMKVDLAHTDIWMRPSCCAILNLLLILYLHGLWVDLTVIWLTKYDIGAKSGECKSWGSGCYSSASTHEVWTSAGAAWPVLQP